MNEIVNKFLLAGDTFMPELHLRQLGFTYSTCRPFTKHREWIQKFRDTADLKQIYKIELDKGHDAVHDALYACSNNLAKNCFR